MSIDTNSNQPGAEQPGPPVKLDPESAKLLKLPGLMAMSAYMILLAVVAVVYVVQGRVGTLYLIFPALFVAAGLGLLLLLRWAWALTLAAVALLAGWFLWSFTTQHIAASLVQGLLNLVFFLYLVRTDVRRRLH
jgi:uncharacterized membrane protein (DUF2068 family)